MNIMSRREIWVLGLVLGGACATPAVAATVTYANDRAGFIAATGAVSIGALPSFGTGNAGGTTVGDVTFNNAAGGTVAFYNFSNEIPGNDLGISGIENFNLAISGGASAIGFYVHEPTYFGTNQLSSPGAWGCNAPCFDTTFSIELFAGAVSLGKFDYNAPNDDSTASGGPLGFFGVYSSVLFDSVRVRDLTNTIDNEIFGDFLISKSPTEVPEPAVGWLLVSGLAALGVGGRRRRC